MERINDALYSIVKKQTNNNLAIFFLFLFRVNFLIHVSDKYEQRKKRFHFSIIFQMTSGSAETQERSR